MHREKTYPYSPIRLLYMAENKPSAERRTMWLMVFLMRLDIGITEPIMVTNVKKFAERHEPTV